MAGFPPPPTFLPPIGENKATGQPYFEPAWLQWFLDIARLLADAGGSAGISHESLGDLYGGAAGNHWHLTQAEQVRLTTGYDDAPTTLAVGVSPWTYQNATGFVCTALVVGGTPTNVEYSRDNVTFYALGVTRAVTLGLNDYLRITHAGAPALVLFPL